MEPERDIEKELKAYADQRRAAVGTPPELHPAARKLLREAASRLAATAAAEKRPWWQTFLSPWPRLAGTGAVFVVLLATVWLLVPGREANRRAASDSLAERQPAEGFKELSLADKKDLDRAGAPTPVEEPMSIASSPVSETKPSSIPLGEINSPAPAAATPPPAAAPATVSGGLIASRRAEASPPEGGSVFNSAKAPQAPVENRPALAFPLQASTGVRVLQKSATIVEQPFRRIDLTATSAQAFGGGSAGSSTVLAAFRVQQDIDKLRVIDSDGSIYTGFVVKTPEDAKKMDSDFLKSTPAKDAKLSSDAEKQLQPLQAFSFRVSGINRTLKQEVVFSGNFLTRDALTPPAAVFGGVSGVALAPQEEVTNSPPFELRKARMEGRLSLGRTNKLEINAVPTRP